MLTSRTVALQAATAFRQGVESIPDLEIVGDPEMCNIAFKSTSRALDVYKVLPIGPLPPFKSPNWYQHLACDSRHRIGMRLGSGLLA